MATATIKLVNGELLGSFYFTKRPEELAQKLLKEGYYKEAFRCEVLAKDAKAVAEEMFDLTNNPSRDEEREERYGRGRSVSVGDIVEVDGVNYLCASMGWRELAE